MKFHNFEEISTAALACGPLRVAVAGADDSELLVSLHQAREMGLAEPVVVGKSSRIQELAGEAGVDTGSWTIIDGQTPEEAAGGAVAAVREGRAEVLLKGSTARSVLMHAVLDAETGLRGPGLMSHVFVTASRQLGRLLLVTDGGINIAPDVEDKARIIANALPLARVLGIEHPRVAVLAAIEKVHPKMPETTDAARLVEMNSSGGITGCTVAGPYALDNALSIEAAARKGLEGEVAGKADILLVPSVLAGNIFCKGIMYLAGDACGGYVAGASAPIVFLSRADNAQARLNSIALGVLMAG